MIKSIVYAIYTFNTFNTLLYYYIYHQYPKKECGKFFLNMGVKKACIFKANSLGSYIVTRANSLLDRQLKIDSESSDYLLLVQSHGDNHSAIYI